MLNEEKHDVGKENQHSGILKIGDRLKTTTMEFDRCLRDLKENISTIEDVDELYYKNKSPRRTIVDLAVTIIPGIDIEDDIKLEVEKKKSEVPQILGRVRKSNKILREAMTMINNMSRLRAKKCRNNFSHMDDSLSFASDLSSSSPVCK